MFKYLLVIDTALFETYHQMTQNLILSIYDNCKRQVPHLIYFHFSTYLKLSKQFFDEVLDVCIALLDIVGTTFSIIMALSLVVNYQSVHRIYQLYLI